VVEVTPGAVQTTVPASGLSDPRGVAVDGGGDVFIADSGHARVVKVTPGGVQTTVTASGLVVPYDVAIDAAGDVFIADSGTHRVVQVTPLGVQTTLAASGSISPHGVAVDAKGDVFIADSGNNRVVEVQTQSVNFGSANICPAGQTTPAPCSQTITLNYDVTASGTLGTPQVLTGGGPNLDFTLASGSTCTGSVTAGSACTVNVTFTPRLAGARNGAVEILDGSGNVLATSLVYGTGTGPQIAFAPATQSTIGGGLNYPYGVAVDGAGDVFIADTDNSRVVEVTPLGVQTTVPASGLNFPFAVAVDGAGDVFIADTYNYRVLEVTPLGVQTTVPASGLFLPEGLAVDGAGDVFIADTANNRLVKLNRSTPPALAFATTPVGKTSSDSPQSVTIQNIGNASLSLTGLSVAANFGQVDGSGNPEDCKASLSLASGAECNLSLSFTPTTAGSISGSAVLTDNALNGNPATQTISLSAAATDTVASFSITGLASTTAGAPENFTVTALDSEGNVDTGFSGTVSISSSDPQAEAGESSLTLTNGVKSLTDAWKFLTAGYQTLTVTDNADSIVSTSAPVLITAATASSMAVVQGSGQSATVNTAFATPLQVIVKDQYGNPVSGATVTFTAPSSGASATLSAAAVTAADGTTSVTATANATAGSYNINAASAHTQSVRFTLANSLATQTINFPQPASPITYSAGLTVTLTATSTSNLAVTYSVSGPATVSGSALTVTGAGTVVVTANQAGNSTYAAATAVQDTIVVNPASQTVNFTGLPLTATFGSAGPYTLNASSTGGGTPTYSVTGPGSITGSTLTINGAGTVIVTASFAATTNYTAASASQTIVVSSASQTVNFTGLPLTATFGSAGPYTLNASSTGGGTPTYSVTGPGSITGSTLTINGAGTVIVTASFAATTNYTATSASQTIQVSSASQTVNFTGLPLTATYGSAGPYLLNGTASSGLAVSYSFSGPANVIGNTLTITGPGTVIVTASQAGNGNYSAAVPVSQTIVVSAPASPYDAAISVQYASTQLVYPGATNITVCIAPAHNITATGSVQIFDGTTLLATISVQGGGCAYWYISPGLAAGNHVLTAVYSGDRNNPAGTSAPTTISVAPVPVKLAPACWLTNTGYGANYQCTVSASSNAGSAQGVITYSYDGASPVSVPVNNGTANFTLTRPAAGNHSVVIAYAQQTNYAAAGPITENFTVSPAAVNVSLTPSSWSTSASAGISFAATVSSSSAGAPNSDGSVEFLDGGTLLATVPVNSNGQASYSSTTLAAGPHTITATYSGGVNYASGSTSVSITLTQ
jgi:sugar lactone lactonase YvrE